MASGQTRQRLHHFNCRAKEIVEDASKTPKQPLYYNLSIGFQIPSVGVNTCHIRKFDDVVVMVDKALEAGFRYFDTSTHFGNEIALYNSMKLLLPKYNLKRSDVMIATKLSPIDLRDEDTLISAFQRAVTNLGGDYIDIFLIPGEPKHCHDNQLSLEITWTIFADIYNNGKVNALGIYDFSLLKLKELMEYSHDARPVLNQVNTKTIVDGNGMSNFCHQNEIVLQSYCKTEGNTNFLISEPKFVNIANKLNLPPAQLFIGWALQNEVSAIISPRSELDSLNQYINLDFMISEYDMKNINKIIYDH